MNVIFVSMDTLRADRLSCLGHSRGLTPNLDRIASEGSLFSGAFASDIPTQPSHTAIFTGRVGLSTTVVSHFHPYTVLDDSVSWLPTMFKHRGYATGAVDHLFSMKDWFKRGYKDYMSPPGRSCSPGSSINEIAFPWLEAKREEGEDIFLFMHFWDPHIPYVPPSPFKERFTAASACRTDPFMVQRIRSRPTFPLFRRNLYEHLERMPNLDYIADLYDAEVAYLDFEINRLFEKLAELDMLEDTIVVLFGDHGENMTEHDAWFDHAGLYDSVTHVPLIIWGPGRVPQSRVESLVQLVDVKPTLLELLDWNAPENLDGRSLLPVMTGEAKTHREVVYLSECTWQAKRGVRSEDWKYIRCIDPGVYLRSEDELYDLRADPTEQRNVAHEHPEVVAEMDALLEKWVDEGLGGRPDPMLEVVESGLPAVRRLDELFNEAEAEPHQRVRDGADAEKEDPPTQELDVPIAGAVVAASLPTAALMAPGGSSPAVTGAVMPETRGLNRRRVVLLGVAAALAILLLAYGLTSLFSGNVEASGQLQPAQVAELNFVSTNQVTWLPVQPGQQIRAGQVLARQDASALTSRLAADQAKLAADQTLLSSGPTPSETPGQLESETSQAESGLAVAQTKAANTSTLDGQAVDNASNQVTAAQTTLANDQQSVTSACSTTAPSSGDTCSSAQHQVAIDQAAVSAAQGALRLAQQQQNTDASNSQSQVAQAQAAVSTARANQSAGTQGQTQTQISSEQAAVNADQAAVTADQKEVTQADLVAPFSGTIAEVNGATGDLAGPTGVQQNVPQGAVSTPSSGITLFPSAPVSQADSRQPLQSSLITLESTTMDVIAQVGESDIGSIHVRQNAQVTFPAVQNHVYSANVRSIDPQSVNEGGKAYFLVHLGLVTSKHHPAPAPGGIRGLAGLSADVTFN